jgi:hypothetical protein
MDKLPVYKIVISEEEDESGVNAIAFVDEPAIMVNWMAFNSNLKFKADAERKIIVSPAMIPDLPIFRRSKEMGEFYVVFDKDQINKIQEKFMSKGYLHNINEMHDTDRPMSGLFMKNSWVSDYQMGIKAPDAFKDLPEGTWFVSYKFSDDNKWNEFVKSGEFNGISVEGFFDLEYLKDTKENKLINEIKKILSNIQS